MSVQWLQNMLGSTLSEKELKLIPYPRLELVLHVAIKALQAFVFIGSCIVAPLSVLLSADSRNWTEVQSRMVTYGRNCILLALFIGPLMMYMRIRNAKEDAVLDRCYRLRKNRVQLHIDRATILGVAAGLGLTAVGIFSSAMFGVVAGISSGLLLGIIYNKLA